MNAHAAGITPGIFAAMLAAALLHASWNAMTKQGPADAITRSLALTISAGLTALPALAMTGLPGTASLPYLLFSALIHIAYFGLIGLAFRLADYSSIYPLFRAVAPLFTALIAFIFLGEALPWLTWVGIFVLSAGVSGLSAEGIRGGTLAPRALAVAAVIGGIVVAYTLVDGLGARVSGNAPGYSLAMFVVTGVMAAVIAMAMRRREMAALPRPYIARTLVAGAMVNLSYGIALWAMTQAPIGLVSALRETSVLFATVIGALFLRETFGVSRWIAAAVILCGLIVMRLA